ncbi:MotA/TolQ/ExbB proton channel family protein [Roseibacillus persicicus]|uniref:Biopolymer transporter ExbB n=1 Tax=Roseibacillus persicicus TaxID=454148 RepID=A0A918TW63_9BACT|nr:MotA/TolQ/ExbB proton channel family protein [Roseibacillus persicicus]MDQ8192261.1 MotA/TolQ/ExbB proton channel family protein [Roseibacillus persicicus]GHC64140.1 biopolymer transporter ExbB [Roseibacillus persicicus]
MGENFQEVVDIFREGGLVMVALASVALILYITSVAAVIYVAKGNLTTRRREEWERWIEHPEEAEGRLGEIIRYAVHGPRLSVKRVQRRFDEVFDVLIRSIDQRLIIITTLIAAAPMTGLLGTVLGMLSMFDGLGAGGGKQSMEMISAGMKEALFTTLTGLVIALPGMFFALVVRERRNQLATVLSQLQAAIVTTKFKSI